MPRGKKANRAARGNSNTPRSGRGSSKLETTFVPFADSFSHSKGHHGLTLQEEARNTERHAFWSTDQRLRHTKVNFVSAGTLDSTKPNDAESSLAKMSLEDSSSEGLDEIIVTEQDDDEAGAEDIMEAEDLHPNQAELQYGEAVATFFVDTQGSNPVQTGLPPPRLRSPSPTPSNSSEEVIVFAGRDKFGRGLSRDPKLSRTPTDPIDARIKIVEDKIHEQEKLLKEVIQEEDASLSPQPPTASGKLSTSSKKKLKKSGRRGRGNAARDEDEELIADYIANMDQDDLDALKSFGARELGGTDDDAWVETEASSGEPAQRTRKPSQNGWNRSDIDDFDDLSTSDGVMGDVQAILSKRDRHKGVQYLVVWEEQTVDEARWVPATTLTSIQALSHIESFEAEENLIAEFEDHEDDGTTDSEEIGDEDSIDDSDDGASEDEKLERKKAAMSDEQIARLLAKQEELGMGSDELLLFDDNDDADEEELAISKASFIPLVFASKKAKNSRGPERPRGEFPSATLLANAYDSFDIMDRDRLSLKLKGKGRKGRLPFDISDSELEASMQMAWENDRSKKTRKKQEREELRAQGMLGSKYGKPDLKQKYKEGMGIYAVAEEIKTFLMSDHTTLSLPPMEKADRKRVHELANFCNLKSSSKGAGTKRFPVLYKTSRTPSVIDAAFEKALSRIDRRFMPRMDISGKRGRGGFGGGKGGGANNAAVSYRDGDIVGGSAPELGAENRGRAMLEKMGWSSGTALGALNNKGIMQPVTHVVKTTKAGLG